MELCTLFSLL